MSGDDTVGVIKSGDYWFVGVFFAENCHTLINSGKKFDNYDEAILYAHKLDDKEHTEYGVQVY